MDSLRKKKAAVKAKVRRDKKKAREAKKASRTDEGDLGRPEFVSSKVFDKIKFFSFVFC